MVQTTRTQTVMEELIGLINIVSKNKVKNIEVIGSPTNYQSKMQKLYDGIASKRFNTSKDAENFLFPKDPNRSQKLKRLTNRLTKRLLNTLFFIDINQPKFNEAQKAYYACYKDFAALKMLIGRGNRSTSVKLGERLLKKGLDFEFTDLALDVLKELRIMYGTVLNDWKKYRRCNELLNEQFEIFRLELKAEGYYIDIARHFVGSNATKKEIGSMAINYAENLGQYLKRINTQRFISMAYMVIVLKHEINNNYQQVIEYSDQAIDLLELKGERKNKTFIISFCTKKINAWIKLGNLEKSEAAIHGILQLIEKNQLNWIIIKDLHLKLLFHAGAYRRAFELYDAVYTKKRFDKIPENYNEQWKLYNAYLHYFIAAGKIVLTKKESEKFGKFRLGKFLNEIPVYAKDKRGGNIQALILQVLFLILNKEYEKSNKQLDALKSYTHRYLKKDSTYRSNCFIHMLMILPKAYHHKKAAVRKARKFRNRLAEMPLATADQNAELEIVPYENLWEIVLESLKG